MTFEQQERLYAIVRGVIGAAAIVLGMYGVTIDQEAWATAIMEIGCLCITLYTWWWKDNNVTEERINAQKVIDELSMECDTPEEVE